MAREETTGVTTTAAPARRPVPAVTEQLIEPFNRLRGEIERLFDDFPARVPSMMSFKAFRPLVVPALELKESDGGYKLTAELPGLDADDVDVSVADGVLTISGEKKEDREEKDKGYVLSERSYGSFERRIGLPADAAADKIDAQFDKGVLTLTVPRDQQAPPRSKKIEIRKS